MIAKIKTRWKNHKKLRQFKIQTFSTKFPIEYKRSSFTLKTVTTQEELIEAFKLRHEVFYNEFRGYPFQGLDIDEFDLQCDHLIIVDNEKNKIVGTYRMNSSQVATKYYTSLEFNLDWLGQQASCVELGRACIHKDYRRGTIMALLWRGISEYMSVTDSDYFFGCGSIKTEDPLESALLYQYFKQSGSLDPRFASSTTPQFTMAGLTEAVAMLERPLTEDEKARAQDLIPSLLAAYLRAGAVIGGLPAHDKDFKCIDFLVVLDRENLSSTHSKRFKLSASQTTAPTEPVYLPRND